MKLLELFTKQLNECGAVKRVWLTSFNIDIEFIETYILPTVLGVEIPRTRMDYEALQLELNEQRIDFRVFCDNRFISTDQNKRTLIPVHGISPGKQSSDFMQLGFDENTLFHAKVIYIEGEDGRILGAGSANLTLSGWGRNREVFQFVPLDEKDLYQSTRDFFIKLFRNAGEECPLSNLRKFGRIKPRARFCHSFQQEAFLQQLLGNRQHEALAIWSPYLSNDLAGLIETVQQRFGQPDLRVHLVADRVEGQYVRANWSDSLQSIAGRGTLTLHQFPLPTDDRLYMTHAKLWKTATHLAIGSWNCTRSGANTEWDENGSWSAGTNIEAGLIFIDNSDISIYLGKKLKVDPDLFATEEQLKDEALEIPVALPFDLRVQFNWGDLTYRITGAWNADLPPGDTYQLKLPSVDELITLHWKPRLAELKPITIAITDIRKLLVEHCYQVFKQDKACGTGLLIETAAEHRRAQQYDDLRTLFDAMANEGPAPSLDDVGYRVQEGEDGEMLVDGRFYSADDSQAAGSTSGIEDISYFRLFAASFQYAARLRSIESIGPLEQWAFSRPGCLDELVVKARERIEKMEPGIFNWFLSMEVNELCQLARSRRRALASVGESIPESRWRDLKVVVPRLPKGTDKRYQAQLQSEYEAIRRSWGKV